jgi:threonine-phosphate decarboxylase
MTKSKAKGDTVKGSGIMTTDYDHGGNVFAVARSLGVRPEEILDFSASINPLGMAPGMKEALSSSFELLKHYPDSEAVELSLALAAFHGLEPATVCVANGSTELIYLLPRLIMGRRALIVAPAFSEYAKALEREGWEIAYLALAADNGFALSLQSLEARLAEGIDALFLCNPGNPTGALLPPATIEKVRALCCATGTFLVLDEAFMDFCEEESAKHLIDKGGGVVLRSLTKFFAIPGLRLGYALGSPEVIAGLAALRQPWSVNTPAQLAGLAALADNDYRQRTRQLVAAERDFLAEGLAAINGLIPYPAAANYLLVEITRGPSAVELRRSLLGRGILIRDCATFYGLDGRFFRVAVRRREENVRLLDQLALALSRVSNAPPQAS